MKSFELDMNTGVLTLSFSETVNSSYSQYSWYYPIQQHTSGVIQQSNSMSYVSVSEPAPEIEVTLTNDDLNEIKVLQQWRRVVKTIV